MLVLPKHRFFYYLIGLFLLTPLTSCSSLFNKSSTTDIEDVDEVIYLDPYEIVAEETSASANLDKSYNLPVYNPAAERTFDLLHTALDLSFDWQNEKVNGVATLYLKPYFYDQEVLVLDAKNFDISYVRNLDNRKPFSYSYEEDKLYVNLDKTYTSEDTLGLIIKYVASPSSTGGSSAITSDKGLFFINPRGEEDKPMQIWTQGETEHNSKWFPTIDKPNERCSQEIKLTVDKKYTTLSNGLLIRSIDNNNGTRTDVWKQDLPHAPYLFMIAVGEFAKVQDKWKDIDVDYY
ncbi:MAG: alanyl aminopeptidase, partial [Saprospiraceae bacterium]|nr:alanyl aminopeptidase [Saprospiraceae bacterium]